MTFRDIPTVQTTLGALREMSKMPANLVAIPPMISDLILDNSFRHDDTPVILVPGGVWIDEWTEMSR